MHIILTILFLHWVADFLLQNDNMALNKSSSNFWLSYHIAVYMLPFWVFFGWRYAFLNAAAHFVVDWCTSRITKRLWAAQKAHWFFVVIGADQLLHVATLLYTGHRMLHSF